MTVAMRAWIEVSDLGTAVVLRIGGELDMATCTSVEPAIDAATSSTTAVIVDLSALTFCDSSGVAMLVAAHAKAKARGTQVTVRGVRPSVRRVFEITGIDAVIDYS